MNYFYLAIVILTLLRDLKGKRDFDVDTEKYANLAKGLFPLLLLISTGGQKETLENLEDSLIGKGGLIDLIADLF